MNCQRSSVPRSSHFWTMVLRPCLATNILELGSLRSIIWLPSCEDGGRVSHTRLLGWSGTSRNFRLLWAFLRPLVVNLFLRGTAVPLPLPPAPGVHVRLLALVLAHGNGMYPGNGHGISAEPGSSASLVPTFFLLVLLLSIWCMLSISWIRSGSLLRPLFGIFQCVKQPLCGSFTLDAWAAIGHVGSE
jgi:hypothetical protein